MDDEDSVRRVKAVKKLWQESCDTLSDNSVVHPGHYNWFGIECMDVVKHFNFLEGNVIKYIWRAGWKSPTTRLEDLKKAKYYLDLAVREEEAKNE